MRNYKSNSSKDFRTEYEKDYHRIIGSASFRRLQDKTQVFPLDNSDFVRTRLTHSLEVSSFAKSLGQNIAKGIIREKKDSAFLSEYQVTSCSARGFCMISGTRRLGISAKQQSGIGSRDT